MRKFKRRQPRSLPFCLFLAVVAALLLTAALAPRANADPTDYWDFEYPPGSRLRPAPELLSQPQGVLINQPLASNYNPTLALNVASGGQPGGFQPLQVDANFSWTGFTAAGWNNPGNWSPSGGPPGPGDTALFDGPFTFQPNLTTGVSVGTVWMTTGVVQNVTLSGPGTLNLTGLGMLGTGILVDNPNAVTLTITAAVSIGNDQAWTNNSGNLFTVSGATVALGGNALTVNGSGDTLISGVIVGIPAGSTLTKDGSGTLTLTGTNLYTRGTTVDGGTLLVNNTAGSGTGSGAVTVNNAGTTLGGTGTISGTVTVNAGANIAPGNGGNNTGTLQTGALTLAGATFRVDINGATPGTFDQIQVNTGVVALGNQTSTLVVTVGTTLALGQTFMILNKVSGGNSTGIFAGIPQGGTVVGSDGTVFSMDYGGGNGNDIVLTVVATPVPEPSTWIGGALAIAGIAFTQRRRLRKVSTQLETRKPASQMVNNP